MSIPACDPSRKAAAHRAVANLYLASRKAPSTADTHDVYRQCERLLHEIIDELPEPPAPPNPPAP